MKILVTGAAGAIGSHVAEAFVREGHEVVGIDSLTPYYRALKESNVQDIEKTGVRFSKVDLAKDDLALYLNDIEAIFHFAAQPGISAATSLREYVDNNIVATGRLLESLRIAAPSAVFVHISTSSIYGARAEGSEETLPHPASLYGVTKLSSEELVLFFNRVHHIPTIILRLFSVYGERERPEKMYHRLIRSILRKEEFPLHEGSENHVRSFTYVGDVVRACEQVLAQRKSLIGDVFNIGNDIPVTTGQGIAIVERLIGEKATIVHFPARDGDQLVTTARIDKARKMFGYAPNTSLEEGLAREIRWYKDRVQGTSLDGSL